MCKKKIRQNVSGYVKALGLLELTDWNKKLLYTLWRFPRHRASAGQIAHMLGWKEYRATNLHMGVLGHRLADVMGLNLEHHIYAIAQFHSPYDGSDAIMTMLPSLAKAVEQKFRLRRRFRLPRR